jgi:type IV secretion system protein VirB1
VTTAAIVKAESGFDPLVIRDNTLKVTLVPQMEGEARALLERLSVRGDKLAVGLMQISSPWFARLSVRAEDLLDACTNIRIGTEILAAGYRACLASGPENALDCALSAYWSGDGRTGGAYVNLIARVSHSTHRIPETPFVSDGLLGRVPRIRFEHGASFSFP